MVLQDATARDVAWTEHGYTEPLPVLAASTDTQVRDLLDRRREVLVSGSPGLLHRVLHALHRTGRVSSVPVAWWPGRDDRSLDLARRLQVPPSPPAAGRGEVWPTLLVRDDRGDVLVDAGALRPVASGRLGAQAYHDDQRIADGVVARIEVEVDYAAGGLVATTTPLRSRHPLARVLRTTGRAVQIAWGEGEATADGLARPAGPSKLTWYVDDRVHWLLRTAPGTGARGQAGWTA